MGQNRASKSAKTAHRGCIRTVLQYIASPTEHFLNINLEMINDRPTHPL